MIDDKRIIKEGSPILRAISKNVELPLNRKTLDKIKEMLKYLEMSQDEELSKKYKLTPGVGLAAPQIGINLRMFAILVDDFELAFINPIIKNKSKDMVYLKTGEGCLSVPNESGLVKRYKEIEVESLVYDPKLSKAEVRTYKLDGYLSIVFQHEYDHLDGILFIDKITQDLSDAKEIE